MHQAALIDPAIGSLLVGSFVLLFISAAAHKLRDLQRFAQVFAGYDIAPAISRWRLTWLVPALELLAAAGLALPATRAAASVIGALLLVSYALAISVNLRAGHRAIACGCGGPDQRRPIAAWMVWRNLLLCRRARADAAAMELRGHWNGWTAPRWASACWRSGCCTRAPSGCLGEFSGRARR
jgi:uncharacterized membrane protein YphA (DoxX/SURF4 family)